MLPLASFRNKLLLAFIAYGIALVLVGGIVLYKTDESDVKFSSIEKASEIFVERENYFRHYVRDINLKLSTVQNSDIFQYYTKNRTATSRIEVLFLNIASTADNIMQLRFIDSNGFERFRVDRNEYGGTPFLISLDQFQNKSDRYYFKEIMALKDKVFWYSKVDLNIENNAIEKPYKPVLRVGTPVFHKNKKIGILIINIFMEEFIREITKSAHYNIHFLDKDGYILVNSEHTSCWNRYVPSSIRADAYFGDDISNILNNEEFFGSTFYSKKIFLDNGEGIRMVLQPKETTLNKMINKELEQLFLVMLGIIILSFPFAYLFTKKPVLLKEEVDHLNATLEERVKVKTSELQELNSTLEAKVEERTRDQNVLLSLFDLGDEVLFKWNSDKRWDTASVSKSVEKLLGYTKEDFESKKVIYAQRIHKDDIQRVINELNEAIKRHDYYFSHQPYRIISKSKEIKWILDNTVIVRDKNNEIVNFVGHLLDITELKNKELELQHLSQTDKLTQLYNRLYLDEILKAQFYRFNRNSEACSVILVDIDYFKKVNDVFGHSTGDSILIEFSQLLKTSIRSGDIVGRWGGEEFLIILPYTTVEQAALLAQKLRIEIAEYPFTLIGNITASFGIAVLKENMDIEALVEAADKALYTSKENGRNCVTST